MCRAFGLQSVCNWIIFLLSVAFRERLGKNASEITEVPNDRSVWSRARLSRNHAGRCRLSLLDREGSHKKKATDFSGGFICASVVLPCMLALLQLFPMLTTKVFVWQPLPPTFSTALASFLLPVQISKPTAFVSRIIVQMQSHWRPPEQDCCCVCASFLAWSQNACCPTAS